MREITISKYCESCWLEGEQRTPAVGSWVIGIVPGESGRPALKVLDLCDVHANVVTDLAGLLAKTATVPIPAAAPAKAPAAGPKRSVPCRVCQLQVNRSSLTTHVWSKHRTDLSDLSRDLRLRPGRVHAPAASRTGTTR